MNSKKKYFFLLIALITSCILYAQKFTASVNKSKVTAGEVFQLDFTLNASGKNFSPPAFSDFAVYSGPNQSTSMQNINGNISQSITFSYYLAAKKEGTFVIGPASITVSGNIIQSNSITIEAAKSGSAQQGGQSQTQSGTQEKSKGKTSSENLFAKTVVSKSKVYAGEQIVVTHKVYTRMNLKGFQDVKFPSYNGFWAQEVPRTTQYEITTENIDGVNYNVVEIKKAYLFAQRSGKLEIEPIEVQCVVREKSGRQSDPFFERFFGHDPFFGFDTYKDALYAIKSNAVHIEVISLPLTGKPSGFSGAVGNFSMNAAIDKEKVKVNEGINLKITLSGKGNLKLIDAPQINFPDEIEHYDPKTNENISVSGGGVTGSKTFEYLLIPRHEGVYKIEPWTFTFFDTEKKSYLSLPSKEFIITAEKGEGQTTSAPVISTVAKEDVKMFGSDIRYIKTGNIPLTRKGEYFFGSPIFIAGFAVPPILFLAFLFFRREHIKRNSNAAVVKKRKANRLARKQLAQARKSIQKQEHEIFFENILSALYNYFGNKFNILPAELSKEKIVEMLKERNIPEEIISEFVKQLDECEFARYAPGMQSGNTQEVYNRVENIIAKIEDMV